MATDRFFFSNTFHFYCNLFCYLLTYLFTYLFFYFLLCINVVDLLSIKKKKRKKEKKRKKKSLQAVSVDEKRIHRNKYSWICEWQPKQWRFSLGSWQFTVFLVWFFFWIHIVRDTARILFRPHYSICAALTLTLWITKQHQNSRQLHRLMKN